MIGAGKADVVVGGQYGDEGKGTVAAMMGAASVKRGAPYDVLARTGGENAEHRVSYRGEEYTRHILPTASVPVAEMGGNPRIVLPSGMTFSVGGLEREVAEGRVWDALVIDSRCAIITEEIRQEGMEASEARGSTFVGVGPTMARKVARNPHKPCPLARDCADEIESLAPNIEVVDNASRYLYRANVLLEASQGTMLSLDHGHYPFCTSRNVTATGALSDAGLSWRDVRRVVMVIRALPTRVPGPSGPTGGEELTWEAACQRAGRPYETIEQTPGGTEGAGEGAGGRERPFTLDTNEIGLAARLNGATEIALTFLDWHEYADVGVRAYAELSLRSRRLIGQIEHVTQLPVTLVRTGPEWGDYIPTRWPESRWGGVL